MSQPSSQPLAQASIFLCRCHQVTEMEVRTAIQVDRARTIAEVSATTKAGSACRGCHCRINRLIQGKPSRCAGPCSRCDGCGSIAALCSCAAA